MTTRKQKKKLRHLAIWPALPRRSAVMATMMLIMLLATALRLHDLSADSLWGDEIFEVLRAQRDLSSILSNSPLAVRLTLTHTFMLIGDQDFLFRFSYAVMGILGVAVMYKVGQALFNDVTGLVAAFLLAISQFHIHFSQEGRSYSWTVFLVLTWLYCLYLALQDNQMRHWIGFSITTAISMSNHLTAASVVASQIAYGALVLLIDRLLRPHRQQPAVPARHRRILGPRCRRPGRASREGSHGPDRHGEGAQRPDLLRLSGHRAAGCAGLPGVRSGATAPVVRCDGR